MGPMDLTLISFGYLHLGDGAPPAADLVVDVRSRLNDPAGYHQVLAMLARGPVDGRDERVQEIVLSQAAATVVLDDLAARARTPGVSTVAIGCGQGHDRSVALAELLATRMRQERRVTLNHRHVDLPRVR